MNTPHDRTPASSAASMPCTRCGATPETGQGEDCPECQGIFGPINDGLPLSQRRTPSAARDTECRFTPGWQPGTRLEPTTSREAALFRLRLVAGPKRSARPLYRLRNLG